MLTGSHKTKCMICGGKDDLIIQYNDKSMIDLCKSCTLIGHLLADRKTMVFITTYKNDCMRLNPGCHHGSEFSNDCIDKFEEIVWLSYFRDWIRKNRRVF